MERPFGACSKKQTGNESFVRIEDNGRMTAVKVGTPRDEISLKAVHDDKLIAYLAGLGIHPDASGVLGRCKFCGDVVTLDNLAGLFPLSGSLKLVCDRAECLRGVQELISEGRLSL